MCEGARFLVWDFALDIDPEGPFVPETAHLLTEKQCIRYVTMQIYFFFCFNVDFTLEQTIKAQRGSRGIAVLFL